MVDNDYDGTFDSFYGMPRDDDVRVGRLSWGEARGHIEFKVNNIIMNRVFVSRCENTRVLSTSQIIKAKLHVRPPTLFLVAGIE